MMQFTCHEKYGETKRRKMQRGQLIYIHFLFARRGRVDIRAKTNDIR